MKTWGDLTAELDTLMDDETKTSYPESLRIAAFNRALEYFAVTHTALLRTVTASASAYAEGALIGFPADFLELPGGGVQIASSDRFTWLEPAAISPGDYVSGDGYMVMAAGVYLHNAAIRDARLWYYGFYDRVSSEASVINVPPWAEWAVLNLAISNCMYPLMVGQSNLRQFQMKREAGSPEDNPPRVQAMYHFRIYSEIVNRVKTQDRSLLFQVN